MKNRLRTWCIAGLSGAIACTMPNAVARAQGATITGTVTSDKGVKLQGANVRIPALSISVGTNADGMFRIDLPADRVRGQTETLQVRAISYLPQARELRIEPGIVVTNFVLTLDGDRAAAFRVAGGSEDPKKLAFTVERYDSAGQVKSREVVFGNQSSGGLDAAFERQLFAPELIMRHQQRIQLTEQQRSTITAEIGRLQSAVVDVQWKMSDDAQKLIDQLQQARIDEAVVLAQIDRITASEALIKRSQLMMLVRIRNVLTAEQQELLRGLRSGAIR